MWSGRSVQVVQSWLYSQVPGKGSSRPPRVTKEHLASARTTARQDERFGNWLVSGIVLAFGHPSVVYSFLVPYPGVNQGKRSSWLVRLQWGDAGWFAREGARGPALCCVRAACLQGAGSPCQQQRQECTFYAENILTLSQTGLLSSSHINCSSDNPIFSPGCSQIQLLSSLDWESQRFLFLWCSCDRYSDLACLQFLPQIPCCPWLAPFPKIKE